MPNRSRLRVGLNLLYLRPGIVGGTETYARGLLGGLAVVASDHSFVVFVNRSARNWPLPAGFERIVCPVSGRQSSRYLYEQLVLPARLKRHDIDVVHSLGYVAPLAAPCASVVTIHDLNYRAPSHRMHPVRRRALAWFVAAAARASEAVIVMSRFVRDEVAEVIPGTSAKLHVVHEAPIARTSDATVHRESAVAPEPYLIAFSSTTANKNLGRLLEAYARARTDGVQHDLVLIGHRPPWSEDGAPGVRWTGYLPDAEVSRLLGGADGLLFPSLYEGFGLPIVEAMQAGVAVSCSRSAALPEVAGDAALFFDGEDVASIAGAIVRLASDPALRSSLSQRGKARAGGFSWERAARETVAVYRTAIAIRAGVT